jgi:hypothetical protein
MSEESDRSHGLTREEKVSLLIALPLAGGLSAVTGKPDGICLSVTPIAELTVPSAWQEFLLGVRARYLVTLGKICNSREIGSKTYSAAEFLEKQI